MSYYQNNAGYGAPGAPGGGPPRLCYQVDFNAVATGKVIAMSKRRIRWRFGFPNEEAVNSGKAGTDCRGEEHDVTLIWSISSGKRMLMSNGHQIYVGANKSKMFEHIWHDRKGRHLRVVANSVAPSYNSAGVRQYDLFIDGRSFFTLPKVYEIGLRGSVEYSNRIPGVISDSERERLDQEAPGRVPMAYSADGRSLVAPASAEQEEEDLKRAIRASLEESRQFLSSRGGNESSRSKIDEESLAASTLTNTVVEPAKPPQVTEDAPLIDFLLDAPAPAPAPTNQALIPVQAPQTHYQVDPFGGPVAVPPNNVAATALVPAPAPPAAIDEFAPQAPTYKDISDQILLNYAPSVAAAAPVPTADNSTVNSANPFDDVSAAPAPSTNYAPNNAYAAHPQMQMQSNFTYPQQPGHMQYQQGNNF